MADSCIEFLSQGENLQLEGDTTTNISPVGKRYPSSRRTHSFSCSSSFRSSSSSFGSSIFDDSSPSSPITPLPFSGIPFSWEQHPGIPKKYLNPHSPSSKTKDGNPLILLPLPPPKPTPSKRFNLESILPTRKKKPQQNFHPDPFVAALMECSKDLRDGDGADDDCYWKGKKASRALSDRIGFIDASCKNSCAVSNSTIFIPKSSRERYHLLNHHRKG
ncbi:uncharacterized protein LOC122083847 [Macadamia integrifolia]|uniref:uncharacterized protein LOC122083847 n=1 Tax=Macadamia integrifolia TaxID=60698 RepID=UPI001C4E79AD|nr:uncharacterized protein LOC122083847 [Macadamia integrifolia]